jgi:nucleotide-binding universal stress UspA family protein
MFDTVLLPLDLNHPASWERALPMAKKVAGIGGKLHVLGIVHDLGMASIASYLPEGFEQEALNRMKAELDAFVAEHAPGATARVGHGHVPERILATADEIDADLIVMASHPPDELMSFLVGSNADRVVRHSSRPVLVVR